MSAAIPQLERFEEPAINNRPCPYCSERKHVAKMGTRKTKARGRVQRYKCNACQRSFSYTPIPGTTYPPRIIAFSITHQNLGNTLETTKNTIKRKYKTNVPIPTIQSWNARHKNIATFTKLRPNYTINPKTIIKTRKLYHQQVYQFQYHDLKTNRAAKTYPKLRTYLQSIHETNTRKQTRNQKEIAKIFESSTTRCSSFKPKKQLQPNPRHIKENNATKLTSLALPLAKNRASRHDAIEAFFLTNDSTTVAVEVPVYLLPEEAKDLKLTEPLTGHIDLLQVRNNKVMVLDYKPDQNLEKAHTQLYLYKRALSMRAYIPIKNISTAAFNENEYVEFGD